MITKTDASEEKRGDFDERFANNRPPVLLWMRPDDDDLSLNKEVDAVLEKISRHGEESLTNKERRILERASRRYQQKQQK